MSEKATAPVGDKQIIIETGKLAKQADGAVTVQMGETIVLVAAVAASKAKPGQDFFPLTVDYREKAAAAGKFPGGYFKREGRPTEKEILTAMEPFRQLATSTRYGSRGTGLGLPLTKALAEANRASFSIKSAVDAGTLVEITFPGTRVLAE